MFDAEMLQRLRMLFPVVVCNLSKRVADKIEKCIKQVQVKITKWEKALGVHAHATITVRIPRHSVKIT